MRKLLLVSGSFLLLLGLLLGTMLDKFASPVLASDAHVAGVQHGMVLLIVGLAWPYTVLGRLATPCASLSILGLYGIWCAFLAGAIIGDPYPSASPSTYYIFVFSSWALILGVAIFLYGLLRHSDT